MVVSRRAGNSSQAGCTTRSQAYGPDFAVDDDAAKHCLIQHYTQHSLEASLAGPALTVLKKGLPRMTHLLNASYQQIRGMGTHGPDETVHMLEQVSQCKSKQVATSSANADSSHPVVNEGTRIRCH